MSKDYELVPVFTVTVVDVWNLEELLNRCEDSVHTIVAAPDGQVAVITVRTEQRPVADVHS